MCIFDHTKPGCVLDILSPFHKCESFSATHLHNLLRGQFTEKTHLTGAGIVSDMCSDFPEANQGMTTTKPTPRDEVYLQIIRVHCTLKSNGTGHMY